MTTMTTNKTPDERRMALRQFMSARDLKPKPWADKAGISANTLYNFLNGHSDTLGQRVQELLATAAHVGTDALWGAATIEAPKPPQTPPTLPPRLEMPRNVEVMGTAAGSLGEGAFQLETQVIDHVRRPPGIANAVDVYAIYVTGDSMVPRYEEGALVYVAAHRPVRVGDYVIVQIQNHENDGIQAYIKRLAQRTPAKLVLEQYNPSAKIEIKTVNVRAVHRVLTMNDLLGV